MEQLHIYHIFTVYLKKQNKKQNILSLFMCKLNLKGLLCVMFIILNILQYFFLSGRHAKSSSRRGNVANESHHCFRGKQMKSCELLESYWAQSWVVWTLDSTLRTLWAWIRQSNHRLRLFIWFQTNNAANIPQGIFVPMYWSHFPVKSNIAYSRLCNPPLERPVPDSNQPLIRRISFWIGLWLFQFQTL